MASCRLYYTLLLIFLTSFAVSNGRLYKDFNNLESSYATITVAKSNQAHFSTIQSAIDSIPSNNMNWVFINVKAGIYREKVTIPQDKPFIVLQGEGMYKSQIVYDNHENLIQSVTFHVLADDFVATNIGFVNSYNHVEIMEENPMRQAAAALVQGDKAAFYGCGFFGLQDTLWDEQGRHYFRNCTIEGAVDFIFGNGQSIYEKCKISALGNEIGGVGYITAQGRSLENETTGFVFKYCNVEGNGKMYLGRAWRQYSRVLFYMSYLADIIVPQGWDEWYATPNE
ncbi:Pectinesterase, catalytic [Dillenia turbinata]|uniref:Pectinesterase n=1 Tax=Dillenia turbinata TaxID=194707 RepID=A0AAN8Z8G2_9MAGN